MPIDRTVGKPFFSVVTTTFLVRQDAEVFRQDAEVFRQDAEVSTLYLRRVLCNGDF